MKYAQSQAKGKARKNPVGKKIFLLGGLGVLGAVGLYFVLRPKEAEATEVKKKEIERLPEQDFEEQPIDSVEGELDPPSSSSPSNNTSGGNTPEGEQVGLDTTPVVENIVFDKHLTLLDYPTNLNTGTTKISKPYPEVDSPLLTVTFKNAPMYGIGNDLPGIAKTIATRMGSTADEYTPTDDEITMLAYTLFKERPNTGGGRITEIAAQRERAAFLWAVVERIWASGKSIKDTVSSSNFVGYYKDFDDIDAMNTALETQEFLKSYVKAFFKGYFPQEAVDTTSWVHAGWVHVKRWKSWSLPSGTKYTVIVDGKEEKRLIENTSTTTPYYIGEAVFSRGIRKRRT